VVVTNTGNVTLTGVKVDDAMLASASPVVTLSGTWPDGSTGSTGTLTPAQSVTFTASYPITAGDITAQQVINTASASGNPPSGGPVYSAPDTVKTPLQLPAIKVVKTADNSGVSSPDAKAGDKISYNMVVTNTGNTTLTKVGLTDTLTAPAAPPVTVTAPTSWPSGTVGTLNAGESVTYTGTYTVTQADIDHGQVLNTAVANGTGPADTAHPAGTPISSPPSDASTPLTQNSAFTVVKSADVSGLSSPAVKAGEPIVYTVVVTNTGNTTLTKVGVTDAMLAAAKPAVSLVLSGT
jgi:uncharacterized repeat protein (TIGR01451 family)